MLIERTIESSRCGRPKWRRIPVIAGEALQGGTRGDQFRAKLALIREYGGPSKIKSHTQFLGGASYLGCSTELSLSPKPDFAGGSNIHRYTAGFLVTFHSVVASYDDRWVPLTDPCTKFGRNYRNFGLLGGQIPRAPLSLRASEHSVPSPLVATPLDRHRN
ncbi:hypothetical protein TNCV_3253381 [Trichonephila clavipes]|nr:hypothetical protein TNCV_3253381 [Trichonephila clavipes]